MRPGRSSPMPATSCWPAPKKGRATPSSRPGPSRSAPVTRPSCAAGSPARTSPPAWAPTPTSAGCSWATSPGAACSTRPPSTTRRRPTPPSAGGSRRSRREASQPTEAAKAWAWSQVVEENSTRSNHQLVALLQGFWSTPDVDLVRPYVSRFFAEVPRLSGMGRGRRAGPSGAVRLPARGGAGDAAAGRGGSGRSGVVARDAPQHRRRRVRAQRGGRLTGAVCAGARRARRVV